MKKENKTIESIIAAEKQKLARLEARYEETARKIKICKGNIEKYTMLRNNEQFSSLSNTLNDKGISIEDIMAAISSGDLLSLQIKIEGGDKTTEKSESEE